MEKFTTWLEGHRTTDAKGERIRPIGEYVLKAKNVPGGYYGGGRLHSPQMVDDTEKAIVVTGAKLLSFEDWTMDWEAVRIDKPPRF